MSRPAARRHQAADAYHIRLTRLIAEIAAAIGQAESRRLDETIEDVLGRIGRFAGVDRSYIFRVTPDGNAVDNTHEWCAPDIEPQRPYLQGLPWSMAPLFTARLRRFEAVHIPRVAELGAQEQADRELLQAQGIQSLLAVPMASLGRLYGFMGFDVVRASRNWSDQEIVLLGLVGEQLTHALQHRSREEELRQSHRRLLTILDGLDALVYVADMDSHEILFANHNVQSVFGPVEGRTCWKALQLDQPGPCAFCSNPQLLDSTGQPTGTFIWEHYNERSQCWYHVRDKAIPWVDGRLVRLEIATDITERKQAEMRIQHLAYHDALTGLPNRTLLHDRLEKALHRSLRHRRLGALLFLDLDRFKTINDSLGHDVGDALLRQVTGRLLDLIRQEDTVARLGGDEFVVIAPELASERDQAAQGAQFLAERLRQELSRPYDFGDHVLHTSPSIGIALFPPDGENPEDLLRHADAAMYRAKAGGRNTIAFFTPQMQQQAWERLELERRLRQALLDDELQLHYQPIVDLERDRLVALEALLRWRPRQGPAVPLERLIQVAEESGLMLDIGQWVLEQACAQARDWREAGYRAPPIAVNLSPVQFHRDNLPSRIQTILTHYHCPPRQLILEITENTLMEGSDQVRDCLRTLRARGMKLAIDDFGTGYSSLSYLRRFPVDRLKIDRSFIQDVDRDPQAAALCQTIIQMAHNLGVQAVAEGVEREGQRRFLEAAGCDLGQGWLLGYPQPAQDVASQLADRTPPADRSLPQL